MEVVAPLISFNWSLVMILITFLILYLIVKKFFFEKIHDFMEAREQKVKDQFTNAEAVEKQAEENLAKYETKLEGIEGERREALKDAKIHADKRAQQVIDEANERADEIIRKAEIQIERERALFVETMRDQVAMLAVQAAEKIIEKQLDEKEHLALIDEIIGEDKNKTWTH
jgi:F-type H+-transporting ATPase subunit b